MYCALGDPFVCFRPSDGRYVSMRGIFRKHPWFTSGVDERYRGYRSRRVRVLRLGKVWYSSDAEVMTCWSRSRGVTCKHYEGLSFFLGQERGHRFFVDPPGRPPTVTPLFRTALGVYCGLPQSFAEVATLLCWTPRDGLLVSVSEDQKKRGHWDRDEQLKGFRPRGYRLLCAGRQFAWRPRGVTVFSCSSRGSGITCKNQHERGFRIGRQRDFDVF